MNPAVNLSLKLYSLHKAYISLQRKTTGVGALRLVRPPTRWFCVTYTTMYLKMLKFALPPMPTPKFALPPTRNPNASQWNIGCVGSPAQIFRVGHVHFMLFIPFLFALWYPTQTLFGMEYELYSLQWTCRCCCHCL